MLQLKAFRKFTYTWLLHSTEIPFGTKQRVQRTIFMQEIQKFSEEGALWGP